MSIVYFPRGNELEIVRRWFSYRAVAKICIFLLATGFAYFVSHPLLREWKRVPDGAEMFLPMIPLAVLFVGTFLVYRLAATCLNRTCIIIGRESLSVRHGPVPWPGNFSMAIADIRFLHATHEKPSRRNKRQLAQRRVYEVHVYRRDGKIAKLAGGLDEGEQALRIVRELEKCSGLKPSDPHPQVVPQVAGSWW